MEGTILLLSMEECCSEILLPQDILIKILLRLPVKVLARFKCVSKSWLSLISDPYFARSHFDLSLAPTHTPLLSLDGTLEIASIDFNAPSIHDYTTKLLKLPIPQLSHLSDDDDEFEITGHLSDDDDSDSDQFEITVPDFVGSCRGFILFRCDLDLCIWNPCTGLQRRIPSPPIYMNAQCEFLRGFGYDSSIDDYLVTLGSYDNTGAETHVIVAIFSVRTNTWKQFDGIISETLKYACVDFFLGGVFFNGANHWIASGGEASMVDIIVAFDLTERVFSEIALPDGLDNTRCCELRVIGGFLSVCPYMLDGFNDAIWVMEEYKVQSSWKSLRFSTPNFPYMLLPICLTGEGDFVGIEDDFTKLVKLNYKGEELESCEYDDFPNPKGARCVVVMHTQSLLSLPCHTLQAEDI